MPTENQGPYSPPIYSPGAIPPVEPIKIVGNILTEEMGLVPGQIMLGLENWQIPTTQGLFIALFYGAEQVIGNNNYNGTDDQGTFLEIQSVVMLHTIEIDLMSFNEEARTRKEEVLWALQSYYAETQMELYNMRLAMTPGSFIPVRSLEPAKQLNRFMISILMNAVHTNTKITPYYDELQTVRLVENA